MPMNDAALIQSAPVANAVVHRRHAAPGNVVLGGVGGPAHDADAGVQATVARRKMKPIQVLGSPICSRTATHEDEGDEAPAYQV